MPLPRWPFRSVEGEWRMKSGYALCRYTRRLLTEALLTVIILPCIPVQADSELKFHGTLVAVECSVNNGKREIVDFGDTVGIHRIDGNNYEQPIPFSLDCKNYTGGNMPHMTLTPEGMVTTFNEAAVSTNVKGLGIEIRNNGTALPLNKVIDLDYSSLPMLTAVPVADPSVDLKDGTFTATLRFIVEVP